MFENDAHVNYKNSNSLNCYPIALEDRHWLVCLVDI